MKNRRKNNLSNPLSILCLAVCLSVLVGYAAEPENRSVFLIGNSLTWDTVPPKLDGDVQWHVDCGKPLPYIFENPKKPCVKTSTLWPEGLKKKQYDIVSVQPHYGSTVEKDAAVISEWVAMQPKAVFVIHTGWSRSASRAEEWANEDASGLLQHSPAYFNALIGLLRETNPGRDFRRTYAMDMLAKVASDAEAGNAPWKEVTELYRDKVHMNVVTGRYMMHNAMRQALGQPVSAAGFEKLDPELKKYFDGVLASFAKKKS